MDAKKDFKIIETMLLREGEGIFLLEEHIERLEATASYFGFRFDRTAALDALAAETESAGSGGAHKLRLLLSVSGQIETSSDFILVASDEKPSVIFYPSSTNSGDIFLRHKTTRREFYDDALEKVAARGFYDAIFTNEKGEITEGARNNVVVLIGGEMLSPPVECGLLPGVYRRMLLDSNKAKCGIITLEDLKTADAIYLCNSVRGMVEVILSSDDFLVDP